MSLLCHSPSQKCRACDELIIRGLIESHPVQKLNYGNQSDMPNCAGDLHFYMRHSFKPSLPLPTSGQEASSKVQDAMKFGQHISGEESMSNSQPVASQRQQRLFSLASFGSLDVRGSSSPTPSIASGLTDDLSSSVSIALGSSSTLETIFLAVKWLPQHCSPHHRAPIVASLC